MCMPKNPACERFGLWPTKTEDKDSSSVSSPHANISVSWALLTNNSDEREAMDIGITTKTKNLRS